MNQSIFQTIKMEKKGYLLEKSNIVIQLLKKFIWKISILIAY